MFIEFLKKKKDGAGRARPPKPKELPAPIGRDMVVKLQLDPDWVWSLRCITRPDPNNKNRVDIRVFNPNEAVVKNVKISDFNSLLEYPGLVLYEGWYDVKNADAYVKPVHGDAPGTATRAA